MSSPAATNTSDTALNRTLRPRHMFMITIGGIIGAGLFVSSSAAIAVTGPAVVLTYLLTGILLLMVMRMLGEMAVSHPEVRSFTEFARLGLGGGGRLVNQVVLHEKLVEFVQVLVLFVPRAELMADFGQLGRRGVCRADFALRHGCCPDRTFQKRTFRLVFLVHRRNESRSWLRKSKFLRKFIYLIILLACPRLAQFHPGVLGFWGDRKSVV